MKYLSLIAALFLSASTLAQAYDLNINASGKIRRWNFVNPPVSTNVFNPNTHAIRYYIVSNGWSVTNTTAEINAIRASFGQWQAIPNTVIKYEEGGLLPPGYDVNTYDNTNIVYWANSSTLVNGGMDDISGALGVTFSTFFSDNTIAQFDIVLNGVESGWFTDFTQASNPNFFIEGTMLHEIGHSLGLMHSCMGGATMLSSGQSGVGVEAGLSPDEVAFAKTIYPASNVLSTLGAISGNITKSGSPVFGAAIIIEETNGNLAGAVVSRANGTYTMSAIPPGNYNVRIVPLDPSSAVHYLLQGADVHSSFASADTSFLPYPNVAASLTAGVTNTLNFAVTNGSQPFRIAYIRKPSVNPGSYSIIPLPAVISPGQSNRTIGVFSPDLPTSGATFTITGDGLTLGSPTYQPGNVFTGLNGISMSISVASNATPGLRTFKIQQGANVAYANGFLEVLPPACDYNFDNLADAFQRTYFPLFTATNAAPNSDPDGDGFGNYAEYLSGSNPTNATSLLKIQSVSQAANGTTVTWSSGAGKRYQLMSRTNQFSGPWGNVGSVYTASGTNSLVLDTSATNGSRFYRIQALP